MLAGVVLGGCGDGGFDGVAASIQDGAANLFSPVEIREMRAAATEPEVKAFYVARQWKPAWSAESGKGLMEILQGAQRHGLDPTPFVRLIQAAEGRGARDAELTLAALRYAEALSAGVVDPKSVHDIYTLDRPKLEVAAGLEQALNANRLGDWLDGLAPQDDEYKALSQAYLAYQDRAQAAAANPAPAGATVRPGAADPRLNLVAARMAEEGYLDATLVPPAPTAAAAQTQPPPAARLTPAMAAGLKLFQADQDLPATGAFDDATAAALNTVAADRARQLAVNLERRRWLARDPAATRIDVNTAANTLVYRRDGQVAWESRTVSGSAKNQTPALGETFKQLVVNPPWNVPDGIAKEEIFPKGQAYLDSHDMYVDEGKVVQRPGPKTALGLVKFDMQNRYAIYLHDTPSKTAFARDERHLSHGCVRVEKAVEFARLLANDAGKLEAFDTALASGETKVVELGHAIPVRLMHHTAYVDDQGRIVFTNDAYGWDDKLAAAMGLRAARRAGGQGVLVSEFGP
jgi:murein L,D-transpeptidase YcbB/YkuD